jgi:hypothetical protein
MLIFVSTNTETMNTTFSKPTEKALKNAETVYNSPLVKEVFINGFTPENVKDHFGISVLIKRGNIEILTDYTFTKKTGKMVKSEKVEENFTY